MITFTFHTSCGRYKASDTLLILTSLYGERSSRLETDLKCSDAFQDNSHDQTNFPSFLYDYVADSSHVHRSATVNSPCDRRRRRVSPASPNLSSFGGDLSPRCEHLTRSGAGQGETDLTWLVIGHPTLPRGQSPVIGLA